MSTRCLTLGGNQMHTGHDAQCPQIDCVPGAGADPDCASHPAPGADCEPMQRVCSYCETDLDTGEVVPRPYDHNGVSHGCCPDCFAAEMAALDRLEEEDA